MEELPPVVPQPVDRSALVAAVEGAEEVAPVPAVEEQEGGRLGHQVGHEGRPLGRGQVARGQPGIGVDHVGGDQRVLEVEGGQVAVGREDGLPGPVGPVGLARLARRGAYPGVLDHRGQVDVPDVGLPVDGRRVEAEGLAVVGVHAVPQGEQPVHPVAGLGLGVGAVELDVAEGPVGQEVLLLQRGHPCGLAAPDGQRADHPLGQVHGLGRPGQLALHPAPSGEGPGGHDDGLSVAVVQRVFGEPGLDQLHQPAVAERVPDTGGHVVDGRTRVGAAGRRIQQGLAGHGDDGRHHQVDRDHVGDALGHPGELTEQAAGVGHDDRLGHPEAPDPARPRFGQRRLDDGRTHDGHGHGRRRTG